MSFNYYHTNLIMPALIMANKEFFINKILPNPNNMQVFVEKESFKIAMKSFVGEGNKPKIKNVTANTIKNRFVVFVEFDDDYVLEDTDNYAVAIAITKEDIRYFTYEKMTDEEGKENQIVGEIVFSTDGNNEHKKYGNTPEYNISYFAGVIDNIL